MFCFVFKAGLGFIETHVQRIQWNPVYKAFYRIRDFVSRNSNVMSTRQTCGQHSGMSAGGTRRAQAFYFPVRICYMYLMSKCREESYLGLCMTSVIAKRKPLRSANFRFQNVFGRKIRQNSPLCSGNLFAITEIMHRPRSDSFLHFDIRNT